MKICLSTLALVLFFPAFSQTTVCGTTDENGSITLTAPAGNVFTTVTFASYGTPNGTCGSFTIGTCHATNSQSIVEGLLIGKTTATINASNTVFGDPCGGTFKRLYIQAVYSSSLPLHLILFSGISNGHSNVLQWQTADEVNTKSIEVERSSDGTHFSFLGRIAAVNNSGTNLYSYTDNSASSGIYFYRLKLIDQDGNFTFSKIIKIQTISSEKLDVFPNPVISSVSISGLHPAGNLEILTLHGAVLKRIRIKGSAQVIDLTPYPAGLYILKYTNGNSSLYQRFVKQ